ncbi:glyoxalase/bleomycin resistance protein/dioxygenase [Caballeronia arationis]|uniref:Glyoxalase-like domain-containing protein n=1 Tax=Caballeronia arationis TaxID=1777142 RepID=A0A7Z7N0U8_9BURK|nr:glyoxalase/bleomycin resistance protein/dioxygenase [Caballeronia arationis]SOE51849.1 Glyoxalase-like domain-containing protein [Caballeronia arationis]
MSPKTQIDHVVVAVRNLSDASRYYRALGFNVIAGGAHGHAPTRNALIVFGDGSFIELIQWSAHSPNDRWQHILEADGEGLVDFAVTTQDLAGLLARAQSHGIHMAGPMDGSRKTLDGVDLRWSVGWPASRELPFACCDVTPRTFRVPEGDMRLHPNGVTGIDSVVVAVVDALASLDQYQRLFEIAGERCPEVAGPGACIGVADFGTTQVVLIGEEQPAMTAVATRVRSYIARRGQGPCALVLRSPNYPNPIDIKLADTCGVALRMCAAREPPSNHMSSTPQV